MNPIVKSFDIGDGRTVSIETGKLAKQADGSVVVRMGDTMLLATVVSAKEAREGQDFFPLTVDYQEKFAAAGRIPGGYLKREGRLGTNEILVCRLIDRVLRPMFPKGYVNDTQVMISLISWDETVMPDALAALAASSALMVSDIPFAGPISEVRVAKIEGNYVINPSREDLENATIDIMVGATMDNVAMVEGEMSECSEQELVEAIRAGHEAIKIQCKAQLELMKEAGKEEKREVAVPEEDADLQKKIEDFCSDRIYEVAKGALAKHDRSASLKQIKEDYLATYSEEELEELDTDMVSSYFGDLQKKIIRKMMLEEKVRLDGRKLNEVRPLWMEPDYLPAAHGSAVFTRGETQALATVTLGNKYDEQMIDNATEKYFSKFMLHYNFPPYSTGEAKPIRGTSRREIGHGNLAERALKGMLPDEYPYTVRIVSDVLESNGSSSMATVCSGSLALMDAGVPIPSGVSGIAMGLISDGAGDGAVLSDILGDEDHLGDMDFKVTGTLKGITACQMDIKIEGLSDDLLVRALNQAKEGREHILAEMNKVLGESRSQLKPHTPRIEVVMVDEEFIGAIIGPGGKNIQELQASTETTISVDNTPDGKGEVVIYGNNSEKVEKALAKIKAITAKPEVGAEYMSTVKSIMPYGAFVEFMPGKEGLLHISEIDHKRIESLDGLMKEGDQVKVKLLDIDRNGRYKLSRKVLLPKPEKADS